MAVNEILIPIAVGVVCLAAGGFGGYCYRRNIAEAKVAKAEDAVKQMIEDAQKRAENIKKETILEAKEEANEIIRKMKEIEKEADIDANKKKTATGAMSCNAQNADWCSAKRLSIRKLMG